MGGTNLSNPDHVSCHPLHRHAGPRRASGSGPAHTYQKKEADEARFRESLEHRLRQAVLTPQPVRWEAELMPLTTLNQMPWPQQRIRAWTQDESRFGLITILRRRLTLRGIKPLAPYQHQRQSF